MANRGSQLPELDPSKNPAVLDTLTWDTRSVLPRLKAVPPGYWEKARLALAGDRPPPETPGLRLHLQSAGRFRDRSLALLGVEDGQCVLLEFGPPGSRASLARPLLRLKAGQNAVAAFHATNPSTLHDMYTRGAAGKLPRALPMTPRLGIGTRMSKTMWPGIWQALRQCSFSANTIQNSLRELNLLEDVRRRRPAQKLYYPGIGFVPEGHTGSTFEGLWLSGVVGALEAGVAQPYGADADHIMVKGDTNGLERARKVIRAARYYSFFTIDVSDILDYAAFPADLRRSGELLERRIPKDSARRELQAYYREPVRIGGRLFRFDESELAGLVGKYWLAMEALSTLVPFIRSLRAGEPFDLELSIDEHPPGIHPFECLTTELEVAFILCESRRRGISLSHLAPNLGVEKHFDYRCPDGLEGLEARTRALHCLASEEGAVLDCHSGDDLSERTRHSLKRATGGLVHFKVSPYLQTLFAEVLHDLDYELFKTWWDDTCEFARENAREGSEFALACLRQLAAEPEARPHPSSTLFRVYSYATVGKRDDRGKYVFRESFYSLSEEFQAEYTRRLKRYLCMLAGDLLR